jgi:hypothetical protein
VNFFKNIFSSSKKKENEDLLIVLEFIGSHFKELEIKTELQDLYLRIYNQPEIHVTQLDVQPHANSKNWLAHGVVEFRLNPERSDS